MVSTTVARTRFQLEASLPLQGPSPAPVGKGLPLPLPEYDSCLKRRFRLRCRNSRTRVAHSLTYTNSLASHATSGMLNWQGFGHEMSVPSNLADDSTTFRRLPKQRARVASEVVFPRHSTLGKFTTYDNPAACTAPDRAFAFHRRRTGARYTDERLRFGP